MAGFVLFGLCDTLGVAQSQVSAKFKRILAGAAKGEYLPFG